MVSSWSRTLCFAFSQTRLHIEGSPTLGWRNRPPCGGQSRSSLHYCLWKQHARELLEFLPEAVFLVQVRQQNMTLLMASWLLSMSPSQWAFQRPAPIKLAQWSHLRIVFPGIARLTVQWVNMNIPEVVQNMWAERSTSKLMPWSLVHMICISSCCAILS